MALSTKETLMSFSYTYSPNLTHQGTSFITEISSSTLHTMVKEKYQCQKQLVHLQHQKCIQKVKNYTIGCKIEVHKFTKGGARTVCNMCGLTHPSVHTLRKMHDYLRQNPQTSMNDAFMNLFIPSTTSSSTPNVI
jgi:hypothetical protein